MSKKKFNKRLETLFADLDPSEAGAAPQAPAGTGGWTWECDENRIYTACSPEVADILGIPADRMIGEKLTAFALDEGSRAALAALVAEDHLPAEIRLSYVTPAGALVPVQMTVMRHVHENGHSGGWYGFCETLPRSRPSAQPRPEAPVVLPKVTSLQELPGVAVDPQGVREATEIWTQTGWNSLETQSLAVQPAGEQGPAALAAPILLRDAPVGVMEVVDEQRTRTWSEDERQLVQAVSIQLSLALENAQLYAAAQQELSERIRAEAEARRHSEELAVINRVVSSVAASLDLRAGLQTVIAELGQIFGINLGAIALINDDHDSFTIVVDNARDRQSIVGYTLAIQENPSLQQVMQARKPVVIRDFQQDTLAISPAPTRAWGSLQTLALLPLIVASDVIGLVGLGFEDPQRMMEEEELRLAETVVFQAAAAIQNARLFEQTQSALAETELLYEISRAISESRAPQDLVELVVAQALPRSAERVSLGYLHYSPDGEPLDFEIVGYWDRRGLTQAVGTSIPSAGLPTLFDQGTTPWVVEDVHHTSLDPVSTATLNSQGIVSTCIAPLRSGGRLMGMLSVSAGQPARYSSQEIRLLKVIGDGIAVALEKHHLLEEAQRRAIELQTAAEVARDTSGTLALDTLLNRAVNMVRERFGFYHASIFLVDESGTYAVVRESTGAAGEEMKRRGHRLAIGSKSVVGTAAATMQPYVLNDVTQSPNYHPNPLLPNTRSELGFPLKIGQRVIGALDVQSERVNAFRLEDLAALEVLADQIAVAIENARAYEISQKAVQEMREVDRVKSQFLANMSHELRTPLNSIIGFSRVILKGIDGPITPTQEQDLTAIYNSGQHLLGLINDILDLSKIDAGKMELSVSDVNLVDLVSSVMSTATGLVKDKPIKLIKDVPEGLPEVPADAMRVRQVLLNLIANAAKFTDEGSITVAARTQLNPEGFQEIFVTITDTGPGIEPEDQAKLFLPFSQVDDSPTRKTGGTGLGLSICRSLIDMHRGRIGLLSSDPGKGSTFYFTLPLPVDENASVPAAAEGPVVLAIDDDRQVISLYERYLAPQGYRVVPLTDPAKAVEKAREIQPFAITLDIMMPEIDGWQVIYALKNDEGTSHIPVIICSILEEEEKGFSLGAADYLVKPILQDDLVGALNRLNRNGTIHDVLAIDDDADDLRLVKKILENSQQYQVTTALGGEQGWEAINLKAPDAIILDLFMPEVNGFAILERLRARAELRSIPVIVLTGADLNADQRKQLANFGPTMLNKGLLRPDELLRSLDASLQQFKPNPRK